LPTFSAPSVYLYWIVPFKYSRTRFHLSQSPVVLLDTPRVHRYATASKTSIRARMETYQSFATVLWNVSASFLQSRLYRPARCAPWFDPSPSAPPRMSVAGASNGFPYFE
jgi:hypothetical protein